MAYKKMGCKINLSCAVSKKTVTKEIWEKHSLKNSLLKMTQLKTETEQKRIRCEKFYIENNYSHIVSLEKKALGLIMAYN